MSSKTRVSTQTQKNWLVDLLLGTSGLLAAVSGIYFLFFPVGGYQGGRNPMYGVSVLFSRATWDDLHTWTGIAMIAVVALHLPMHWSWVVSMSKRMLKALTGRSDGLNARGRFNLAINFTMGMSFFLTALSGVYLLLVLGGRGAVDPLLLFSRAAWDGIHTWAGAVMILAVSLHFAIHWKWVVKVTRKHLRLGVGNPALDLGAAGTQPVR